jgi:hypothetical protein
VKRIVNVPMLVPASIAVPIVIQWDRLCASVRLATAAWHLPLA